MGIVYFGICHDCKRYIDLDKFYSWAGFLVEPTETLNLYLLPPLYPFPLLELQKIDNDFYKNDRFIHSSLRLHIFIALHNGHRLGVYTEDQLREKYDEDQGYIEWLDTEKVEVIGEEECGEVQD